MRIAESKNAAVFGHHQVALTVRRRHYADDGRRQVVPRAGPNGPDAVSRDRPHVAGISKGEHAPVGCHQPVAFAVSGERYARDGALQVERTGRPVGLGATEGKYRAVSADQPIALLAGHLTLWRRWARGGCGGGHRAGRRRTGCGS